jgi:hypothetical protein
VLKGFLRDSHLGKKLAAHQMLEELAEDDSQKVCRAAGGIIKLEPSFRATKPEERCWHNPYRTSQPSHVRPVAAVQNIEASAPEKPAVEIAKGVPFPFLRLSRSAMVLKIALVAVAAGTTGFVAWDLLGHSTHPVSMPPLSRDAQPGDRQSASPAVDSATDLLPPSPVSTGKSTVQLDLKKDARQKSQQPVRSATVKPPMEEPEDPRSARALGITPDSLLNGTVLRISSRWDKMDGAKRSLNEHKGRFRDCNFERLKELGIQFCIKYGIRGFSLLAAAQGGLNSDQRGALQKCSPAIPKNGGSDDSKKYQLQRLSGDLFPPGPCEYVEPF